MKSSLGYLAVVVPPDILDESTSHDMTADEGQNVTLTCNAVGLPDPQIEWRREGRKPLMSIGSEKSLLNCLISMRSDLSGNYTQKQFNEIKRRNNKIVSFSPPLFGG